MTAWMRKNHKSAGEPSQSQEPNIPSPKFISELINKYFKLLLSSLLLFIITTKTTIILLLQTCKIYRSQFLGVLFPPLAIFFQRMENTFFLHTIKKGSIILCCHGNAYLISAFSRNENFTIKETTIEQAAHMHIIYFNLQRF